MKLDKGTFGKSKSDIWLIDIMNAHDDKKLVSKILSMIHKVVCHLKELRKCKPNTKAYASSLIIKQYEEILNDLTIKDPKNKLIYSLTNNVFRAYLKRRNH